MLLVHIVRQYHTMGPSPSKGDGQICNAELLKKMDFVLTEQSKNFSEISIYRLNEKPYDYYMRYRETVVDSEATRANIALKRQLYRALEGVRCLVKVDASEISNVIELCSNTLEFDSYGRYHNYTLQNAIECKLSREKHFKEADLLYIMGSLLQVGEKVSNILGKSYKGLFKAHKIYLSTEGYIKLYPFQLVGLAGTPTIRIQEDTPTNSSSLQEVEVNITPKKGGEEERARNYKDDLKDLAALIIQLILLSKQDGIGTPSKEQLQFCLGRQVSQGLKSLLLNLISNKAEFTYEAVAHELESIKDRERIRPSYCIRLEQDISLRESEIMKRQEDDLQSQKQQQLRRLSSIHQNLVPSRIELLYRRNTNPNQ